MAMILSFSWVWWEQDFDQWHWGACMLPRSDEVDAIRAWEKDWNLEGGKVSQELDVMVKSYLKRKLCLLFSINQRTQFNDCFSSIISRLDFLPLLFHKKKDYLKRQKIIPWQWGSLQLYLGVSGRKLWRYSKRKKTNSPSRNHLEISQIQWLAIFSGGLIPVLATNSHKEFHLHPGVEKAMSSGILFINIRNLWRHPALGRKHRYQFGNFRNKNLIPFCIATR